MFKATTSPEVSEREIKNAAAVRELAGECMVLLENDGTLPLKNIGNVALYGAGARKTVKGGTGSGDVNVRYSVSVEEGLEQAGFTVTTKDWLERQVRCAEKEHAEYAAEMTKKAEENGMNPGLYMMLSPYTPLNTEHITENDVAESDTDLAVYVISRNSGEGKDRTTVGGDYMLSDDEIQNLTLIAEKYEKIIVLLNIGGVIDTAALRAIEGINAIVLLNQLGSNTGVLAADLLTGKAIPSGKLVDTWAQNYSDYSSSAGFGMNDGDVQDEYYNEGIYTGYRYFDSFGIVPAYEFGYGKTYTAFEITNEQVSVNKNEITVSATVKNTGATYSGKEVVQVYVSAPEGKIDKPYQELSGFVKTKELAPGEEENVTVKILAESLASYCEKCASWVLEKGEYIVRVGNSSRNTKAIAAVVLDKSKVVKKLKNLLTYSDVPVVDIKPEILPVSESQVVKIEMKASDIPTEEITYTEDHDVLENKVDDLITIDDIISGKYTAEELAAQLSDEDMAYLSVGNSVKKKGFASVVGQASDALPGAAGETTDRMKDTRNIRMMELCDGPAGIRVSPEFIELDNGLAVPVGGVGSTGIEELPDGIRHYQYATAIPIAFALASSWNSALLEKCGDIAGGEMEEFGVTLWLAPGMNIHRNPLCGRNFEYYSEDPLLAGKCAAAITRGVQRHAGVGTTIKHFFANSQEDNRMFTNSHISERACREIYLKNFEIAVKESQPMSVMTSYNLVNSVHSANNIDLLTAILRDEWGFKGMVMTDWLTTSEFSRLLSTITSLKYEKSDPAICIKAGNDLIEPGEMNDVQGILDGLANGKITRGDLQACAVRILTLIAKTHLYNGGSYYEYEACKTVTFE